MTTNSPNPVDGEVQVLNVRGRFTSERFLSECLKPEEISGEKQRARIEELMMWFDRYYLASANPKWLRGHVAELCYYIMAKGEATPPAQLLRPVELPGGFSPAIGDIFDRQMPVMRRDREEGCWIHKAVVAELLRSLGHEVK